MKPWHLWGIPFNPLLIPWLALLCYGAFLSYKIIRRSTAERRAYLVRAREAADPETVVGRVRRRYLNIWVRTGARAVVTMVGLLFLGAGGISNKIEVYDLQATVGIVTLFAVVLFYVVTLHFDERDYEAIESDVRGSVGQVDHPTESQAPAKALDARHRVG